MTTFIRTYLFLLLLGCASNTLGMRNFQDTDTVNINRDTLSNSKSNSILSTAQLSGQINYHYFEQSNPNNYNLHQPNITPRHQVTGNLSSNNSYIPITINFIYNPNAWDGEQFKFNISYNSEAFNRNMKKKYENQEEKYTSYQDSLLQTNLETRLRKQVLELQLQELQDSLKNQSNDTNLVKWDSTQILDSNKIDTHHINAHQKQITNLNNKIQILDQQLASVNSIFQNDSLLDKNARKFDFRQKVNPDSLDFSDSMSKTEKFKSSINSMQMGTISPQFSTLLTHRSTIKGLIFNYKLSSKLSINSFGGWQLQKDFNELNTAIKSIGLQLVTSPIKNLDISLSGIHNYKEEQSKPEYTIQPINNSLVGLSISNQITEIIKLGGDINLSLNSPNLNLNINDNSLSESISYSVFSQLRIQKTKSSLNLELINRPSKFINYLTPYQIPGSKEWRMDVNQFFFRSKLKAHLALFNRNSISLVDENISSKFRSSNLDIRTNWKRFPNLTYSFTENRNQFINPLEIVNENKTMIHSYGINYLRRIKKTKLYIESIYQNRKLNSNYSNRVFERIQIIFKMKSEKWNWRVNLMFTKSHFNSSNIFSNTLNYNLTKQVNIGIINRIQNNIHTTIYTNGFSFKSQVKKVSLRAEVLMNSNPNYLFNGIIWNSVLSYKF